MLHRSYNMLLLLDSISYKGSETPPPPLYAIAQGNSNTCTLVALAHLFRQHYPKIKLLPVYDIQYYYNKGEGRYSFAKAIADIGNFCKLDTNITTRCRPFKKFSFCNKNQIYKPSESYNSYLNKEIVCIRSTRQASLEEPCCKVAPAAFIKELAIRLQENNIPIGYAELNLENKSLHAMSTYTMNDNGGFVLCDDTCTLSLTSNRKDGGCKQTTFEHVAQMASWFEIVFLNTEKSKNIFEQVLKEFRELPNKEIELKLDTIYKEQTEILHEFTLEELEDEEFKPYNLENINQFKQQIKGLSFKACVKKIEQSDKEINDIIKSKIEEEEEQNASERITRNKIQKTGEVN